MDAAHCTAGECLAKEENTEREWGRKKKVKTERGRGRERCTERGREEKANQGQALRGDDSGKESQGGWTVIITIAYETNVALRVDQMAEGIIRIGTTSNVRQSMSLTEMQAISKLNPNLRKASSMLIQETEKGKDRYSREIRRDWLEGEIAQ
jgi:hypothetical protein